MNPVKHPIKKTIFISFAAILLVLLLVFLVISPLTKYLVERYDLKYTGRQITLDRAYVNPFTGYVYLSKLKVHEWNSDSVFFACDGMGINIALCKLLFKTYEISELTMDHPRGDIIQDKRRLNFDDLIVKFTTVDPSATGNGPAHINILDIKIRNGEFHYCELQTPVNYFIKNVNFESPGIKWDTDTVSGSLSFLAGIGRGEMKCDFTINVKTNAYRLTTIVHHYDLNIIEQYMKALSNYGTFSASLDAEVKAEGSFNDAQDIKASGQLVIRDFHFGKSPTDDYAAFDKLSFDILELNPKDNKYLFDTISLNHPYFKYEMYDQIDNLETMFGKAGANISAAQNDPSRFNLILEITRYVKVMARNFFQSYYRINRLAVYKGDFKFNDFSLNERFSVDLNPLTILADSIDKSRHRVEMSIHSGILPFGVASINLSINPNDTGDFDMQYSIEKMPVSMLNPYILYYTSFPLDRGTLELYGTWNVRNSIIQSKNHMVIIDPRVTKRIRNKELTWIPMPLLMSFIRERGNVIDYEIPITGNLKNPHFHLHDVVADLFKNIFVKPATTAYRSQVKNKETDIEKYLSLQWQMRQNSLRPNQVKFIEKMASFLEKDPEASIHVYLHPYTAKEKEYILFFEAKKKYFLFKNPADNSLFSESDSLKTDKMSVKDSMFVRYLNNQVKDSMLFTTQDKCIRLVGSGYLQTRLHQLAEERENAFMAYFKKEHVENKVKIMAGENTTPYNGFSLFKIDYKGETPKSLIQAYQKMNELNDKTPRKKFRKERDESKGNL